MLLFLSICKFKSKLELRFILFELIRYWLKEFSNSDERGEIDLFEILFSISDPKFDFVTYVVFVVNTLPVRFEEK